MRSRPAAVFALTLATALLSVPLSAGREAVYDTVLYPLNAVVLGFAGMLILSRLPRHAVGWLLAVTGLEAAIVELTEGYGYLDAPGAETVFWVSLWGSAVGAVKGH